MLEKQSHNIVYWDIFFVKLNFDPSLPFFLPFTQNIVRQPIPENSLPYKPFVAEATMKKNQKILFCPLLEHFEISVPKPPIDKRVKSGDINA